VVALALGVVAAFTATAIYPIYLAPERRPTLAERSGGAQRRDYVPVLRGGQETAVPQPGLQRKGVWANVKQSTAGTRDSGRENNG
jgi:hypothetical protein